MCFHLFVNPYCRSNSVALQPSNVSHRNYRVRRESCRLKTLRKFLKMREINEGNPIPPNLYALTFWIIAINQVTISIQVSLLFSCLLQQSLLPTRKLGL